MLTNEKFICKLEKFSANVVKIIFAIIVGVLFLYSIIGSAVVDAKEHTTYLNDNIILNLITIVFICIIAIIMKKRKLRICKPVLYGSIAVWVILCIFWIFLTKLQPRYDQYHILNIAMYMKRGDNSFFSKRVIF